MNEKQTILVVDDELTIRRILRQYLEKEGYRVIEAQSGGQALQMLHQEEPDLMILDIMLPGMDGFTMTRALRDPVGQSAIADIPIIMLTARNDERDRITGFELGTDDYVTKPFSPREVVMRVKALLRRTITSDSRTQVEAEPLVFEGLRIEPDTRIVERDGQAIELTNKEYELLFFLASNARRVYNRNQLLDQIWGYDFYGDDSNVTVHIHRLREKLEVDPAKPQYIHTVWGVGYKFDVL